MNLKEWIIDTAGRGDTPPFMVAGSYLLHLEHGTDYNDIDIYMLLSKSMIKNNKLGFITPNELELKDSLEINDLSFKLSGEYNLLTDGFVCYRSVSDGEKYINLIIVEPKSDGVSGIFHDILRSFDLDILRIGASHLSIRRKLAIVPDIKLDEYIQSFNTNICQVKRLNSYFRNEVEDDPNRIAKYKHRFPDMRFIREYV